MVAFRIKITKLLAKVVPYIVNQVTIYIIYIYIPIKPCRSHHPSFRQWGALYVGHGHQRMKFKLLLLDHNSLYSYSILQTNIKTSGYEFIVTKSGRRKQKHRRDITLLWFCTLLFFINVNSDVINIKVYYFCLTSSSKTKKIVTIDAHEILTIKFIVGHC